MHSLHYASLVKFSSALRRVLQHAGAGLDQRGVMSRTPEVAGICEEKESGWNSLRKAFPRRNFASGARLRVPFFRSANQVRKIRDEEIADL